MTRCHGIIQYTVGPVFILDSPTIAAMDSFMTYLGFLFFICVTLPISDDQRTIVFPENSSVGIVTVAGQPVKDGSSPFINADAAIVGNATGVVSVSKQGFVGVQVSRATVNDLGWLDTLPVDALQSLTFTNVDISAAMLEKVTRLTGLINLQLNQCQFESACFQNLPPLPLLQQLQADGVTDTGYASWVAKCPQLRHLFVFPRPSLPELTAMAEHPALGWTAIALEADPNRTLQVLGGFPKLRNLTISVGPDVEAINPVHFAGLAGLEHLSWYFGSLDGDALKALGIQKNLKTLTVLQASLRDDLLQGLSELDSLEELGFLNMDDLPFTTDQLIDTLAGMPNLKKWPRLPGISSSGLKRIVTTPHLEQLTIAGISDDIDQAQFQTIRNLTNLTHLDLQNMRVNDDWISCLADLHQLEYLQLFDTEVVGSGFEQLSGLSSLRSVKLFYSYIDDKKPDPKLQSLKALPNLESLEIGGRFSPDDLLPLSEFHQLRSLRLHGGGFSDDSTAEMLANLSGLKELMLTDNCVISDEGANALSKLPQLEALYVNGFLSKSGVERLTSMPTLRQLVVSTSMISEQEKEQLTESCPISSFWLRPYTGTMVAYENDKIKLVDRSLENRIAGKDGLFRKALDQEGARKKLDALEGVPAPQIVDAKIDLRSLRGKVVLVEFWGTWCGPCRMLNLELKELYVSHRDEGLEIIGVHTPEAANKMAEYLQKKDIKWPNMIDGNGSLAKTYSVPHYPSLYLIDRKGILRVALPHNSALADTIKTLLAEE